MELMILCAGAGAKDWHGPRETRPMRTKGKRQAQKIGAFIGRERLCPDKILTDGSLRAVSSVQKALKAAGRTARGIETSDDLGKGTIPDLARRGRTLLVALPGTVRKLLAGLPADPPLSAGRAGDIGPGTLLRLTFEPGRVRLIERVDAGALPDLFPYPALDGADRRERPAYYYRQSAVIPFRKSPGGTEILIVGSSSGRHWTVPKGIVEPGLSPAASARIEAREEAGIEGRIRREPIGSYAYGKWGATCDVTVFAMAVTRVLEGADWEERHRRRRWVSPDEAAELLVQPGLKELVVKV